MVIGNPVSVQFYASKEEKEAFRKACFYADTTMSREFRKFMRDFIRNPPEDSRLYHQPIKAD